MRRRLSLAGRRSASGVPDAEDAGVIHYGDLQPQALWWLRTTVGELLSASRPAPKRRLVEFKVAERGMRPLSDFVVGTP